MKPDVTTGADVSDPHPLLQRTVEVVAGFVSHNSLPVGEIPALIQSVHTTLRSLAGGSERPESLKPAIAVRKSVSADYIVCLEDGKKLKMLKRYLRSRYQLSPDEYRLKWGLPADYPMVAPNYAAQRSAFAKRIGLGRKTSLRQRRKTAS